MAGNLPAIRAMQETVNTQWKSLGIPTGHLSPQCIATYTSQITFMFHIPLMIQQPPGWDCVVVYWVPQYPNLVNTGQFSLNHALDSPPAYKYLNRDKVGGYAAMEKSRKRDWCRQSTQVLTYDSTNDQGQVKLAVRQLDLAKFSSS